MSNPPSNNPEWLKRLQRGGGRFAYGFQWFIVVIAVLGVIGAVFGSGPFVGRLFFLVFWGGIGAFGIWRISQYRADHRKGGPLGE